MVTKFSQRLSVMRFCTKTLGCKVNQYEMQAIENILRERGHELVTLGEGCDICIVNTCAVTAESVRKSRQAIRRMKKLEPNALIAVSGCYSQLEQEEVAKLGVDLISGVYDREEFALKVEKLEREREPERKPGKCHPECSEGSCKRKDNIVTDSSVAPLPQNDRYSTASSHARHNLDANRIFEELPPGGAMSRTRALLKIQDGCDNYCAFCIVPYARGRSRSLPLERIAEYAKQLEEQGYKEIIITGIEISSYGKDFASPKNDKSHSSTVNPQPSTFNFQLSTFNSLPAALKTIHNAAPNARLRLGSLDPAIMTDEFCQKLSEIPNICSHFHLSLQSGCDETLKRMGRKYTISRVQKTIKTLRDIFPNCGITADLITGFPGETDDEFEQTLKFIKSAAFSDMHIFPFSMRPGTKAADMPGQIMKSIRKERARAATDIAREMAQDFKRAQIGKTARVLFEQEKNGYRTGHSENYIEINVKEKADKNSIHNVRITGTKNGLVLGEIV